MTFPVDPSLRSKVRDQIEATASQLPLEENDAVISYINYFSSRAARRFWKSGLRRSGPLQGDDPAHSGRGRPAAGVDLPGAGRIRFFPAGCIRRSSGVGLWQFLKSRGEEYGLQVTRHLDERLDPEKATRAAARHLHDLYTHVRRLVSGDGGLRLRSGLHRSAVTRTGYADFWTLRRLNVLPKETANYVPIILAMIIVSKNAKDYGLEDIGPDSPLEYETVRLESADQPGSGCRAADRPSGRRS